jgi:hypothetical protein
MRKPYRFLATNRVAGSNFAEIPADINTICDEKTFDGSQNDIIALVQKIARWWGDQLGQYMLNVDTYFGLAYTSSSDYPALWVCNIEYEIVQGLFIQGFTVSRDGHAIMLTQERDETPHWFDLGRIHA